jgi:hypothetical protein
MRDGKYYPKGMERKDDGWGSLPNTNPSTNIDTVLGSYVQQEAERTRQEAESSLRVSASFERLPLDIGLLMQEFPDVDGDHLQVADACVNQGHYFAGLVLEVSYDG